MNTGKCTTPIYNIVLTQPDMIVWVTEIIKQINKLLFGSTSQVRLDFDENLELGKRGNNPCFISGTEESNTFLEECYQNPCQHFSISVLKIRRKIIVAVSIGGFIEGILPKELKTKDFVWKYRVSRFRSGHAPVLYYEQALTARQYNELELSGDE
jgi:hypothetical protein